MKLVKHTLVINAVLLCTAVTLIAGTLEITWQTIDGGGVSGPGASTSASFAIAGTIAQPDASSFTSPMSGGNFTLVGGFWTPTVPTCALSGDMDLNTLRNGLDIQDFVNCLLGGGTNCTCADTSGNGSVGIEDVSSFVSLILAA
jgi:hypothetical protein